MQFSILIPVYNTEKYLEECINSVLHQTEQSFEIILADDFSTDRSGAICDWYAKNNADKVRVIHNAENCGLLATRRKLFSAANGEWVLCVDSDDFLRADALEKISDVIHSSSPDMVVFNLRCFHMDGSIEVFKPEMKANYLYSGAEKEVVLKCFFQNNYLNSVCTKACRRKIIDSDVDYSQFKISIGEDAFQSYPMLDKAERIYYLNEELYSYRKNEGSMTAYMRYDYYDMFLPFWKRDRIYREKWQLPADYYKAEDRLRVKKTVQYLRRELNTKGYSWLKSRIEEICKDGYFRVFCGNSDVKGRYKVYCHAILTGNALMFYVAGKIETVLLLAKKGSK